MSDRWVFLIAFLTVIVIVAGAFAMPQYFTFELLKSLIFLAIALLVFFGGTALVTCWGWSRQS